jgi:tape measure domain-containing protein
MAMNMDAILRVVAKVDGGNALQKLGADLAGVGKSAGASVSPFGQMRGALRGVADVAATIGLATVGRTLLNAGIEAEQSSIRINALAKQYGEVAGVTDVAARAAEQFALGNVEAQNAVTDLYGRLRPMGVSLQDIEAVFFGVNKAAKQVGLSTYDTSEVLLQLSQALGSGKLQGDELRSIMERMPAVGQAVAKVMGVSASEIKKLGSEGKITTKVMIEAAAELNKIVPPPPTAMQEFDKALKDLRTELGENLLPIFVPFVQGITTLVKAFAGLPEPIQTAAIALVAFAVAAGPVASVITGIGQAMMIIGSLKIGAIIAGLATAFIVLITGPVGIVALLVAAGIAIYAFRDQIGAAFGAVVNFIGAAFNTIGNLLKAGAQAYMDYYVKPILGFFKGLYDGAVAIFSKIGSAIGSAFQTVVATIKNAFRGMLQYLVDRVNVAAGLINVLIRAFNRLPNVPDIPVIPSLAVPAFAQGGVVDRPTLAMVGEGGEREYVVPESKMAAASSNYLAGARGGAVLAGAASGGGTPTINITTGPVMEFDGKRYVSVADMERAMRLTAEGVIGRLRTPSARIALGIA